MTTHTVSAEELLKRHGIAYVNTKKKSYTTICPECGNGYLNVTINRDGVVWYCQGCQRGSGEKYDQQEAKQRKASGRDPITAVYDYTNEQGELLFQAVRFQPLNGEKYFRQRTGPDQKKWTIKGVRRVLYRLPELIEDLANERVIFLVEGEKDVISLRSHSVPATTNPMGAAVGNNPTEKWRPEYTETLRGADVVICGDNDAPGREHVKFVARNLHGVAGRVRVLDLAHFWEGIEPSDDISDWFEASHTVEELWAIVERLPDYMPGGNGQQQEPDRSPQDGMEQQFKPGATSQAESLFDPWARYVVPEFPLGVLPPAISRFVTGQSAVLGSDPSAMAMATLAGFSGALDHRFALKMMRHGQWWERPRLWVLLVGDPAVKKTPTINGATRPLEQYERYLRTEYEARMRDYQAAKDEEDGNDVKKPDPPPRYVVWDSTIEKLGDILSRSDHGLLVKRDEFSGWIGAMEKYSTARGAGADRGFWLQAFDGGPYTIDRVNRGETYVRNLSVSLIGGIQPARLAELHGLTSDGLLQRFLPVMMTSAPFAEDIAVDDEAYAKLMFEMIKTQPQRLFMADDALWAMTELRRHLHEMEQASGGLAEGFQSFVGKLAGLAGSLTLILHLAADPKATSRPVSAETVANVSLLVRDFILPHAFEFYRTAEGATNGDRLKKLASYILTAGKPRLVASDLTTNIADFRGLTLLEVNQRASALVAAGWISPVQPKLGPMNRAWNVNPVVFSRFADQAQAEEARKAAIANLMGSPRKPRLSQT